MEADIKTLNIKNKEQNRLKLLKPWWEALDEAFNILAPTYNLANKMCSFGLWQRWQNSFIQQVDLHNAENVLDLCAGTCLVTQKLLQRKPSLNITAVDRNWQMLNQGIKTVKGNVKLLARDAHNLDFAPETFDIVVLSAAGRHLSLFKVFQDVYKILKTDGYFYFFDMTKPAGKIRRRIYYCYLHKMIFLVQFFLTRKNLIPKNLTLNRWRDYFIIAIDNYYTSQEIAELMQAVGFVTKVKTYGTGIVTLAIGKKKQS